MATAPSADRFAAKVRPSPNGCLLWTASVNNKGYGTFTSAPGQTVMAHRWAYEQAVGPIPIGLQLDHLCGNRNCVSPAHLEPVTALVNLHRAESSIPARNAAKTACPAGHSYLDPEHLYIVRTTGARRCRTCHNERRRARRSGGKED